MASSIGARQDFENAVEVFHNAFAHTLQPGEDVVSKFKLTQSALILEQPLIAANNLYTFSIKDNVQNQNQQFNTEVRLVMQETFVPTHIQYSICHPSSNTDTTFIPDTYLNPFKYINATAMQSLYNGALKIVIDNRVYTKNWDLLRHYKANQTQQTAPSGAGSPLDQQDLSEDGFYPMQPFVILGGAQLVEISILYDLAPSAVDAFSRIRLHFRGVNAQGSTVVG